MTERNMTQAKSISRPTIGKTGVKKPSRAGRICVLHPCPDLEPTDVARETVTLAVQMQRSGWRALIASNGGPLVLEAERAAVRHGRMPLNRHGLLTNWRNRVMLEALIQRERPALIHAHGIDALVHAIGLCRIHRLPLVADFTQPLPNDVRTKRILKQLNDMGALIRVPSDFMAQQLREIYELSPEHVATIPPGIDMRWHDAGAISPERLHSLSKLWRIPEQATVVLAPMPLSQDNGQMQLLAALAKLKRNDVFTVLVGDDREDPTMREQLDTLVSQYGLEGKVIMPDYCMDWPAACWLASTVVAPNTVARGQAVELLAAQAVGRPVIITNIGANPEMVLSGETAWVIPPDDVKALAEALREAIDLPMQQRVNLSDHTRNFIEDAFPQSAWLASMIELYEILLHPAARPVKTKAAA
jgi:glycosyltransferase involved in cell wall biosynthesis